MNKVTIELHEHKGAGLIISDNSGILYANQTGGYACKQSIEEGLYVSLGSGKFYLEECLGKYFTSPKYNGWCDDGIDKEDAEYINSKLFLSMGTRHLTVDEERLKDSHEAWIFVKSKKIKGVLTWENSD